MNKPVNSILVSWLKRCTVLLFVFFLGSKTSLNTERTGNIAQLCLHISSFLNFLTKDDAHISQSYIAPWNICCFFFPLWLRPSPLTSLHEFTQALPAPATCHISPAAYTQSPPPPLSQRAAACRLQSPLRPNPGTWSTTLLSSALEEHPQTTTLFPQLYFDPFPLGLSTH